jgi:hypothetical protein
MATMRPVRLSRLLVAALGALTAMAGCGTGDDQHQVRATTAGFFSAVGAHRGGEACRRLSPALAKAIEQRHSVSRCSDAVARIGARGAAIALVHVYATSARADLAGGDSVFLGLMRDGWRIDALGCRPRASGPYDCEEQG